MKTSHLLCGCATALIVGPVAAVGAFIHQSPTRPASPLARARRQPNNVNGSFVRMGARPQTRSREVHGNIMTRRTINDFDPALPRGWDRAVERAVEAAMYAPNHRRSEPWRFYLLGPKSVGKVCELNAEIVSAKKGEAAGEKKLKRWLQMPGWLVVTCRRGEAGDTMENPAGMAREDYAACCCAVQNLCLSLNSQGMGTKWTTGPVNFDERFAEAVGFDPDEEYTVGTIWFGTAKQRPHPPAKKMGLDDILKRVD